MISKNLVVFCEGPTEQVFCSRILRPHLFPGSEGNLLTLAVGSKGDRHVYGLGAKPIYERLQRFIQNRLKANRGNNYRFTTFIDLYALPENFPGLRTNLKDKAKPRPFVEALESAFGEDIGDWRFLPHIQLHEFETLLFADPDAFAKTFEDIQDEIQALKAIAEQFPTIEHIDDGSATAPSKRIIGVLPSYRGRKVSAGPIIAEHIGLSAMRGACPHFNDWIHRLESIEWQ